MKKEAARTRIYRETQHVARKMHQLLLHESPRRRMESVTPRGLDVTCFFRLLAVGRRQDLSSKRAARGVEIGTHDHTVTATSQHTHKHTQNAMKKEAATDISCAACVRTFSVAERKADPQPAS